MKRPKFRIDSILEMKRSRPLTIEMIYILKEHWFWFFYKEVHRSPKKESVELLKYHLENPD